MQLALSRSILDALENHDLRDDTIGVFTSDRGDMMGSRGLLAKCVMFEKAVRMQLMIRIPGRHGGKTGRGDIGPG